MQFVRAIVIFSYILAVGCHKSELSKNDHAASVTVEKIRRAKSDVVHAQQAVQAFPRLDIFIEATKDLIILRQVEKSDSPMNSKTLQDLTNAQKRAAAVLSQLAYFTPFFRDIETALLTMKASLYHAAYATGLSSESRNAIWRSRSQIDNLLDDLDLILRVLLDAGSVNSLDSDYYDPDFLGVLAEVESTLEKVKIVTSEDIARAHYTN